MLQIKNIMNTIRSARNPQAALMGDDAEQSADEAGAEHYPAARRGSDAGIPGDGGGKRAGSGRDPVNDRITAKWKKRTIFSKKAQ